MSDRLHPALVTLTLLDLAFVAVTDTVSMLALLPLLVLALVSPWLRQLQSRVTYRTCWNVGVLVVFAMLVQHASTTGLLHMLEDGMLLAVLCQVHLLNNVGRLQRPDLVFFNSFLIAFVTSFFAATITWSVLFVAHAVVFVPALQLNVLARREGALSWPLTRRVIRDSLPRTAIIGAVTVVVFVFCPRDFEHEGWLGDALARHAGLDTGIADIIDLDDDRAVELDDRIVMRIESFDGEIADVPSHWRAIAFSYFDGQNWLPQEASRLGTRFATDPTWDRDAAGTWHNGVRPTERALRVELPNASMEQLPLPLSACEMTPIDTHGILVDPKSYGGFAFFRLADAPAEPLVYTVRGSGDARSFTVPERISRLFVELPRRPVTRTAKHLLEQATADLPEEMPTAGRLAHCASWLRAQRRYALPGGPGFAGSIDAFAIGSGAGHCEYFATVLALMLRHAGVPCRLVGGFLAQERADDGAVIVRARHAHAWVEALLPDGSWLTLDATPASAGPDGGDTQSGWWHDTKRFMESAWAAIVGFDDDGRARLLTTLGALPGAIARLAGRHPFATLGLLGLPIALLYARWRRRRPPATVAALVGAARALGLALRPGETPRELLARARGEAAKPTQLAALATAVEHHERLRYGGSTATR